MRVLYGRNWVVLKHVGAFLVFLNIQNDHHPKVAYEDKRVKNGNILKLTNYFFMASTL